jgi:hypothetical protein
MVRRDFAAALVRPDKYVFGCASSGDQLAELFRSLRAALFPPGGAAPARQTFAIRRSVIVKN